jgi:hypothetical protein
VIGGPPGSTRDRERRVLWLLGCAWRGSGGPGVGCVFEFVIFACKIRLRAPVPRLSHSLDSSPPKRQDRSILDSSTARGSTPSPSTWPIGTGSPDFPAPPCAVPVDVDV